jgi:hypothetical protein
MGKRFSGILFVMIAIAVVWATGAAFLEMRKPAKINRGPGGNGDQAPE